MPNEIVWLDRPMDVSFNLIAGVLMDMGRDEEAEALTNELAQFDLMQ